jgi:hypothetical protein
VHAVLASGARRWICENPSVRSYPWQNGMVVLLAWQSYQIWPALPSQICRMARTKHHFLKEWLPVQITEPGQALSQFAQQSIRLVVRLHDAPQLPAG